MAKERGLGIGLEALFPESSMAAFNPKDANAQGIRKIPISKISPNSNQPRKTFNEDSINELSVSIKRHGLIQPLIVEETSPDNFTIVAGERRWRASKLAGLEEVPVIVNEYGQEQRLEIALVENIQREDLNPIDEAEAYKQLMEATGLTQEEVSTRVGKSRSAIANALRLLGLPQDAMEALRSGDITAGHARAILAAANPADRSVLLKKIVDEGISVREAETIVTTFNNGGIPVESKTEKKSISNVLDPDLAALEQNLIGKLGTKVTIKGKPEKGTISIEYFSMDDLNRLYEIIVGSEL